MLAHMDRIGIDKALLMAFDEAGTESNFRLAARFPDRFLVDCNVESTPIEELERTIRSFKEKGAVGLGEFKVNRRIDDAYIQRVFAICQELDMPVTFHMSPEVGYSYGIVDEPGLPLLEASLKRFPRLTFIAHSQSFWIEFASPAPRDREGATAGEAEPSVKKGPSSVSWTAMATSGVTCPPEADRAPS